MRSEDSLIQESQADCKLNDHESSKLPIDPLAVSFQTIEQIICDFPYSQGGRRLSPDAYATVSFLMPSSRKSSRTAASSRGSKVSGVVPV